MMKEAETIVFKSYGSSAILFIDGARLNFVRNELNGINIIMTNTLQNKNSFPVWFFLTVSLYDF